MMHRALVATNSSPGLSRSMMKPFFERIKVLLAEAEECIYVFSSAGDIDRIEMLHERLSEAGETERESFRIHQFGS